MAPDETLVLYDSDENPIFYMQVWAKDVVGIEVQATGLVQLQIVGDEPE